ncbi:MAG: oligosaccharide flippase family protein [Nanoarchaeota archaeon]
MTKINKDLVKGSFILIIFFGLFNLLNFLFQFTMARKLSVDDYGILAALTSLVYIFVIFAETTQTAISDYVSKEKDKGKVKDIILRWFSKGTKFALVVFVFYSIIAILFSIYAKIDYPLLLLNGLFIFSVFVIGITRGALQGEKKFFSLGVNMVAEATIKLSFAIFFVLLGFKVYGAVLGVLLGAFSGFLLSFIPLKDVFNSERKKEYAANHKNYLKPAFLITSIVFLMYTLDVLIAKIFLDEFSAGAYAIAATIAKTIFFGTLPVSKAMFPLSSSEESKKESNKILFSSIGVILVLVLIALSFFYLIPDFIIKIFSGKIISESVSVLFYLGIGIGLVSLSNLILLYKLSRGITKGYGLLAIFPLIEIILLIVFSGGIVTFARTFAIVNGLFFIGSVFLPYRKV